MKKPVVLLIGILFVMICHLAAASAQSIPYEIGPGDVIEISVWRDESLSRTLVVPPDGVISFPLIGNIMVDSMTVENLRARVSKQLADYVPNATVTVILQELKSLTAYVIGNVSKPGQYAIGMDTTVMQLLAMAGGLTPFASEKKVHILRRQKDKTIKIPFSYSAVLNGDNLEQNIVINKGDVIVVP